MGVMQGKEPSITAVFAHRGCTEGFVENTLEAFAEAKRLGADGVELDVRLTSDGALAVHHDPLIDGLGPVAELTVPGAPRPRPPAGRCPGGLRGHGGQRGDQERPGNAGTRSRRDGGGRHGGGHCRGGLDRSGDRLVVPGRARCGPSRRPTAGSPLGVLWPFLTDIEAGLALAVAEGWSAVHPFVTEATPELVERAQGAGLAVNVWTVNARQDLVDTGRSWGSRRSSRIAWSTRCPSRDGEGGRGVSCNGQ